MTQPDQLLQWPAIIKLHNDDELIFISDPAQFAREVTLQLTYVQAQDRLIDMSGAVYRISNSHALELIHTDSTLSLHDVVALLRLHLSNNGNCCVSKFDATSIREAIMSVFA